VAFITTMGPLIVIATVVVPAFIAAWLVRQEKTGKNLLTAPQPASTRGDRILDHLYRALVLPLTEFVGRMGWSLVLVLALVLTYRITDSVWGTFAYPFYLGELQYSKDEVAFASKFFGVGAVVLGLALGGYLLTAMGRMQTLLLGAILAALTNLLYADLSVGGYGLANASRFTGFSWLVETLGSDVRMAKLLLAIGLENLAIGIAGAAFVAWLSSIVAKGFSAVQYALLSSLTMLVGTLGRGALGQMIEERGYFDVFILTTAIGGVAVILVIFEWVRSSRQERRVSPAVPDSA
jgi:PAT family beta-lactamase induction signal transducer AmpG